MIIILIILCIYFSDKPQKAPAQGSNDPDKVDRLFAEWKAQREADEAEAIRQTAILAEEKRQEQEEKLKRRIADADGEIEYQRQQIERLRQHMEHSEIERDACVYGSTRYFQWDKKCMTLEHQIHTAEARLSKAKDTKFFCEDKLAS